MRLHQRSLKGHYIFSLAKRESGYEQNTTVGFSRALAYSNGIFYCSVIMNFNLEPLVPDRVVQVQQALFNLPMGMRSERKYVSLYIVAVLLCSLNLGCVSVWFISA
jgi:hypothetical protein